MAAYLVSFSALFHRRTGQSVERYVTGLLTDLGRENCDTIVAAVAGTSTERLRHLLSDATGDPLALDEAHAYQVVALSPPGGVLLLDDMGLPKQGTPQRVWRGSSRGRWARSVTTKCSSVPSMSPTSPRRARCCTGR